jgi:hypothetical protein
VSGLRKKRIKAGRQLMRSASALRAVAVLAGISALAGCETAGTSSFSGSNPAKSAITIVNDQGGQVIGYAWQIKKVNETGTGVRFAGRCDSACTLYLAAERSCILPGATFGFHAPYGANAGGNRSIRQFMLRNYPQWVRDWLFARGGLTENVKTMPYSYARHFIPTCGQPARIAAI